MKRVIKSKTIKSLMILGLVMAICPVAFTVNETVEAIEKEAQVEVLTILEQNMQKEITIDLRDTPIDDVIRVLADQADVDIIKSPNVIGNVTATLTNVPLEEALRNILAAHGYGYVLDKNMIRVAPLSEINESSEALVNRVYRITYADVTDVETALKKFISSRGAISASIGTSNIIVSDTESRIKAIDTFLEEIDRITPQVLVEVRIYDITSREQLDLGIEWSANRTGTGVTGDPAGITNPFIAGLSSNTTTKTGSDLTGALRFGWLTPNIDIDVLLKAQHEVVEAKLLANPRILVLDNERALFDIITEQPYIERTITDGSITETVKFKDIGVKLEVTPHIARDDMIRLHIMPEFGVLVERLTLATSDVPVVDTRKVNTIALLKSGQTVVLGGMRKKDVSKQVNKVPLLGDLPLLGFLFRSEGEDTATTELVVFITPKIINDQPIMTPDECKTYQATNFSAPEPMLTKAEKADRKLH